MTYQRGHRAVMNTHTVGGVSERSRYIGMDQYGNKYYEDFSPYRRISLIKIRLKEDGLSTMIICQSEVQMEI